MYKQVILVRQDLQLPKGKACAQVAHAAVEAALRSPHTPAWRAEGMAKVVLKVADESMLVHLFQEAKDADLIAALITDAGKTVVAPGTKTCVGVGPAPEEELDALFSSLKLL